MSELTFDYMYNRIWDDPIAGAQAVKAEHQSYRRRKYEFAVLGYALAAKMTAEPPWQSEFYELPFFAGGYTPNPEHLLLHCMQFLYEDRTGSDSDRAAAHASAMAPLFMERTDPTRVLEILIHGGGFRALARGHAPPPAPEPPQQRRLDDLQDATVSGPIEGPGGSGNHGIPHPPGSGGGKPPRAPKRPKTRNSTMKGVLDRYLLIAMEPLASMYKLLALDVGESRLIQITRVESESGDLIEFEGKMAPDLPPEVP